jgi:hypothetical protein
MANNPFLDRLAEMEDSAQAEALFLIQANVDIASLEKKIATFEVMQYETYPEIGVILVVGTKKALLSILELPEIDSIMENQQVYITKSP